MDKGQILRQYFGHEDFRPGQGELIDGVLAGRDVLGIMPTGGGKSVCYQVPALLMHGLTLVVSPLISLMKDQVAALNAMGLPGTFLNSSQDAQAYSRVCREIRQGMHKLVYVAPERLEQEGFLALMRGQEIAMVAVDEAHCISQWGQDFRPSYLKIPEFLAQLPKRPVLAAFTATATAQVRQDIAGLLGLKDPVTVVTGFDRPNLFFDVKQPKKKDPVLLDLVLARREKSGIVYCATRKNVEKVCDLLRANGLAATRYHAGLSEEERRENQDDFRFDRAAVMVATNAFGMGIDKSNVGYVIHYNMPKSLEAYYQEAGRAGRDGEAAQCILLYAPGDVATAQFFIQQVGEENGDLTPEEVAQVQARDYQRLEAMTEYCKSTTCLRAHILDYFGQAHGERCGNCGPCRTQYAQVDITRPAQMILSCVPRVKEKLGYYVGKGLLTRVLRGSRERRVLELGLDQVSTYGLMKEVSPHQLRQYMDAIEAQGLWLVEPEHSTVRLTDRAKEVLFGGEKVYLRQAAQPEPAPRPLLKGARPDEALAPEEAALMETLRSVRSRLAREENVPLYVVFSNATLADMARRRPRTMGEFLDVSGVGEKKAKKYGKAFLEAIAKGGE